MTYKQMLNRQAYNQFNKLPNVADYHLMIGDAEELAPMPTLVLQSYVPKQIIQGQADISKLTDEEIAFAIENNILEPNDFNSNIATIGEGLGGI